MPMIDRASVYPVEMLPGVIRRTLTDGDKMMLIEVSIEKDAIIPMHTHPHEQTGYLVSGRMRLQIEDETQDLSSGNAWMIPGGVPHEAIGIERCLVLEVFSPPRDEYR